MKNAYLVGGECSCYFCVGCDCLCCFLCCRWVRTNRSVVFVFVIFLLLFVLSLVYLLFFFDQRGLLAATRKGLTEPHVDKNP